jgi:hypothetical protein
MVKWAEECFDQIDAGLFSGDAFFDPDSMNEFQVYLDRWQRQLNLLKEMVKHGEIT